MRYLPSLHPDRCCLASTLLVTNKNKALRRIHFFAHFVRQVRYSPACVRMCDRCINVKGRTQLGKLSGGRSQAQNSGIFGCPVREDECSGLVRGEELILN
jgi:hypothetical protein